MEYFRIFWITPNTTAFYKSLASEQSRDSTFMFYSPCALILDPSPNLTQTLTLTPCQSIVARCKPCALQIYCLQFFRRDITRSESGELSSDGYRPSTNQYPKSIIPLHNPNPNPNPNPTEKWIFPRLATLHQRMLGLRNSKDLHLRSPIQLHFTLGHFKQIWLWKIGAIH